MIEEGLILPACIIRQGKHLNFSEPTVLLLQAHENVGVWLDVCCARTHTSIHVEQNLLLLIDREQIKVLDGLLVFRRLRIDLLSKLLAFVDLAASVEVEDKRKPFLDVIELTNPDFFCDKDQTEKWFLTEYFKRNTKYIALHDLLRRMEHYSLVRYLLDGTETNLSLHDLGKMYGLSYSHFRRLCKNALGGKVKTELCSWRMARCILDIIEGKDDMTTIAHKYGYSSSSHFSAEVRNRLGITPRELCRRVDK